VKPDLASRFDVIQSCGAVEHVRDLTGFIRDVSVLLRSGSYFVFTYEPEPLFSIRQSPRAPHIGTFGREEVFHRKPHDVHAALTAAGLRVCEDLEFKAYLGLVHHLVTARSA
jgi:2-polyprenyl-3-methyl-5-hydroxy-6-metoxy-1,4-benzoquinol methylase